MEKLLYVIYFLPSIVCLLWIIPFLLIKKTARLKTLICCLAAAIIYFATYAMYCIPGFDYSMIAIIESVSLPMSIITLGLVIIYLTLIITDGGIKAYYIAWLIPGLMYGASLTTLFCIVGYDNAGDFFTTHPSGNYSEWSQQYDTPLYHVFQFVDYYLSSVLGFAFFLVIIVICIYILYIDGYRPRGILKFLLEKKRTTPTRVIALSILILIFLLMPISADYHYVAKHMYLSLFLSLGIALDMHTVCFAEYHSRLAALSDKDLRKVQLYDDIIEQKEKEKKEKEGAEKARIAAVMERDSNRSALVEQRRQSLSIRFRKLMEEDRLYLRDDISVAYISQELGVGRTILSTFISDEYGTNFRGVINGYRIKHAKEYMLNHPSATQETVALACGYKDAVSYSHKFKETTGYSPTVWMASNNKE